MSTYKVAQDVEAEDKLIGPFSFRQFVYLIIVALAGAGAWGLSQLFIPLAIVPLPIILFFGALALPLKKDQPMETYMAAIVSFYLKPRVRLWQSDGIEHLIEITAPKEVEPQRTKDIAEAEAIRRLSYLADIADSRGWSIRHSTMPNANGASMIGDVYHEAQQVRDPLADDSGVANSFNSMISQADSRRRQAMVERMQHPQQQPQTQAQPQQVSQPAPQQITQAPQPQQPTQPANTPQIAYNPYPNMHQSTLNPNGTRPQAQAQPATPVPQPIDDNSTTQEKISEQTPESTSATHASPDIINLANNSDLSIETIAHEAKRIKEKQEDKDGEVFISLH